VADSDNVPASINLFFDTFAETHMVIEVEDYNFNSGSFLDNPTLTAEDPGWFEPVDGSYMNQPGTQGIDFNETRTTPRSQDAPYRKGDAVRMARTLDESREKFISAGGPEAGFYDYDVADFVQGEWMNYTRTFAPGSYEVYLRESVVNIPTAEAILERVTSDPTTADQTTTVLGSFLGAKSGYKYRTVPLTDGTGANRVILRLSGVTTLRLRQNTTDPEGTGIRQNYLMFVPVADPGVQRANIASISPAPNSETSSVDPVIRIEVQNRDTTINLSTVALQVNGQTVTPTVTSDANGAVLTYALSPRPASGASNTSKLTFKDNLGVEISSEWSFIINYTSLNAANRASGTGNERGFNVRLVQSLRENGNLANSLARAEEQLSSGSTIPEYVDTTAVYQVINFHQDGASGRNFPDDVAPPGLNIEENGAEDFAVEITGYLDLAAGVHRFGVVSDDGYKVTSGPNFTEAGSVALGFHSGGTADETFEFVAPEAGLYPFRMVWYERGGDAHAEFFSVNRSTGEKILINDPNNPAAIKAYISLNAVTERPKLSIEVQGGDIKVTWTNGGTLQWSDRVDGGWTAAPNAGNGTFTTPNTGTRFFRVVR
jgi:hypothetical protein